MFICSLCSKPSSRSVFPSFIFYPVFTRHLSVLQTGVRPQGDEHEWTGHVGEDRLQLGLCTHLHVDTGGATGPQRQRLQLAGEVRTSVDAKGRLQAGDTVRVDQIWLDIIGLSQSWPVCSYILTLIAFWLWISYLDHCIMTSVLFTNDFNYCSGLWSYWAVIFL